MTELETLREKVLMYETLMHKIQLHAQVTMNEDALNDLIGNICNWSRAHRCGDGLNTPDVQEMIIRGAFEKLLDRR